MDLKNGLNKTSAEREQIKRGRPIKKFPFQKTTSYTWHLGDLGVQVAGLSIRKGVHYHAAEPWELPCTALPSCTACPPWRLIGLKDFQSTQTDGQAFFGLNRPGHASALIVSCDELYVGQIVSGGRNPREQNYQTCLNVPGRKTTVPNAPRD